MLPYELLRARISRGRITPLFCAAAPGSGTDYDLASRVVAFFANAQEGRQCKGDLLQKIGSLESEHDYKLVRGLSALLERRCVFGRSNMSSSVSTPMLIRRKLFEESARRGLALSGLQRQDIIRQTAAQMHVSPDGVESIMWSDKDENLVLARFDAIGAKDLILWYNLSLFQTLLFRCARLEFYVKGGVYWKQVLRNVKKYGLMYTLEYHRGNGSDGDDSIKCVLEGPLSLFRMTDRYGTSMAKLLPSIVRTSVWKITGSIVKKTDDGQKIYSFELSSKGTGEFLRPTIDSARRDGGNAKNGGGGGDSVYDSSTEAAFAKKFYQHFDQDDKLGWRISREPDPLVAGGKAMIPDFLFERFGRKVYFEIVGFWTKEYLERKGDKIQALLDGSGKNGKGADLLVAINSELACSRIETISKERIFTFQKDVSIKPVLEHLRKIDAEIVEEKSHTKIRLGKDHRDLISIRQIALENSIPEDAVLKIILADYPGDYIAVGSYLISREKIKATDDHLGGVSRFADVCRILASQKIPDSCHAALLSKMGYDVVWEDLDPDNARVSKGGA